MASAEKIYLPRLIATRQVDELGTVRVARELLYYVKCVCVCSTCGDLYAVCAAAAAALREPLEEFRWPKERSEVCVKHVPDTLRIDQI